MDIKEAAIIFCCTTVGIYFMFATYFCVKNELKKDESMPVEMFRTID